MIVEFVLTRRSVTRIAICLLLLGGVVPAATASPAVAQERVQGVPRVVDGDTLKIAGARVRLAATIRATLLSEVPTIRRSGRRRSRSATSL